MTEIHLQFNKKIYFASDFHLGSPDKESSLERERRIVRWLESVKKDAQVIFLVGDIFDFWFEYKNVIPKGFIRLQGKLAELTDEGIEIIFFTGNHDMWMFDYFDTELGIKVYREPQEYLVKSETDTSIFIGHGDGLGPGDYSYKLLKKVFENRLCRFAFNWLHPDIGMFLAHKWSGSRKKEDRIKKELQFKGDDEWLLSYAKEVEAKKHHDLYIFGHRHLLLDLKVAEKSRYINLGEWCYDDESSNNFAVFDGKDISVIKFKS
ncbi:UDP-2,3-diacylglucosamine hydrolase [Pseudarcicella hirudinis]|uniref:UDP-2,3-diacylglucosamine hydrolase n=1 Tax=Pseudarcicella hirudinis TaxID=1079859 RepID=A0A1I5YZJ0_9BACT|nr:UDP-2,3-diacylglucosamine diphosphatase [Pseudarcicella hirudinis]SFQ49693.1 UDP-2,3-diacylglucosamine hydrolase [Pseudarcicella hirudinis]